MGAGAEPGLLRLSPQLSVVLAWLGGGAYLGSLLLQDLLQSNALLRRAQAAEAQARLLAREAELHVLRSQINPHFLFNSLNSISALTTVDAAAARQMTIELAGFFRRSLTVLQKEKIALKDELVLIQHFLAVEKCRYGQRLQLDIEVTELAQQALVPSMLLQPCVENAIKHGLQHSVQTTVMTLRAWVLEDRLYVTMQNSVEPGRPPQLGTGTGLVNLQSRLAALYGQSARAQWAQAADSFSLEIILPLETHDPERY